MIMIIIDLSQIMVSNLMTQIDNKTVTVEEDLLRHMILNCLRTYVKRFKSEYGDVIIACDSRKYWRKDIFPYYKANRKKNRESMGLDWNSIFTSFNKIKGELKTYFPYRCIEIEGAEADDIIGTLVETYANTGEKFLIVSGDKDFIQLQVHMNVKQYDPIKKKFLESNDPAKYMKEHIMRGDTGDGVPNFLSPDDCIVLGKRQTSVMKKKLDFWVTKEPEEFCDSNMLRNYCRNKQLVDLSMTPVPIKEKIVEDYNSQSDKPRNMLMTYFIEMKLKNLLETIGDF